MNHQRSNCSPSTGNIHTMPAATQPSEHQPTQGVGLYVRRLQAPRICWSSCCNVNVAYVTTMATVRLPCSTRRCQHCHVC